MGSSIFWTLIDWITSMVISIINVFRRLGLSLLEYLAVLFSISLVIRVFSELFSRARFALHLRKVFRKKGAETSACRPLYSSFFARIRTYSDADFTFRKGDKTFAVKFFPGFVKGYRVIFENDGLITLKRFFWKKKYHLSFAKTYGENAEYILLFAPDPKGFYEYENTPFGAERFPLFSGGLYQSVVFCSQSFFFRQLERILDGYVDSFRPDLQKRQEE